MHTHTIIRSAGKQILKVIHFPEKKTGGFEVVEKATLTIYAAM